MLHIVLFVLKIIGIILASVLGLLIALVLAVLLVPIRYRLRAEYEEDLKAAARVTWLLRIVSFTAEYGKQNIDISEVLTEENERDFNFRMRLRIFGKIIFDSSKRKEEKTKAKLSLFRGKKEKTKPGIKKKEKAEDILQPDLKHSQKVQTREKAEPTERTETVRITKAATEAVTGVEDGKNTEVKELAAPKESISERQDSSVEQKNSAEQESLAEQKSSAEQESLAEQESSAKQESFAKKESSAGQKDSAEQKNSAEQEDSAEQEKGISRFFKNISSKIKRLWDKLKAVFAGIKEKFKNIRLGFSEIYKKYELIRLFFQDENNKLGLRYGFDSIKGILRHIRPRKVRAYVEFGTGDPCSTGQILGVAAAFMGIYKDSVQIIPDFNEKVLKGNFYCRGRIQSVFLLIIGIKVIRNRDIKALINNFKTLKEEF